MQVNLSRDVIIGLLNHKQELLSAGRTRVSYDVVVRDLIERVRTVEAHDG